LAKTVYTVYDRIFDDFPAKNTIYIPCIYIVLANPKDTRSNHPPFVTLLWWECTSYHLFLPPCTPFFLFRQSSPNVTV
jgi:hypothetical protein